ncbi:hypothetical protein JTB14_034995 [Gonioctena quinquepunctata]|nr:hypothetical protein JTB14_034995 [Gonioctena quinquepunctata]
MIKANNKYVETYSEKILQKALEEIESGERTPEGVTSSSANISEKDIRGWFKEIEAYLRRKDYMSILEDPARVFNGDETGFYFCPKLGKAPKGTKNAYEIDLGEA